jgi:hypothetical protein
MSLPWRPELQQVKTISGCETLQRRRRVKWRRKSEFAFRTPLWVLNWSKNKTAMFQERFAISDKEFRSRQSVGGWAGGWCLCPALHPAVDRSRLASLQVWVWIVGTIILTIGIALVHWGHAIGDPIAAVSSLLVLADMLLFGWLVIRREPTGVRFPAPAE